MSRFNGSQNIGDIVSILPKAGEIFKEYNIDFCCGGNRPLADAIREQHLDETAILGKLEKAYEDASKFNSLDIDFRKMTMSELTDYIVETHHNYLKKVLPELGELTTKILRVHGKNHGDVLSRVHRLFHNLKTELEQHLIKEEEILFPMVKDYDKHPTAGLIDSINRVMNETEAEHEAAGDILKELRRITDQYWVPEDGCATYRMTFKKLEELETDLFQHIHLENNILFKTLELKLHNQKM